MNTTTNTGLGAALLAAVLLLLGPVAARADTTLVYEGGDGRLEISMRPGEIRIDDAGEAWQLYRADDETIYAVSPSDQSYTRLDKQAAEVIRDQMEALRARMENRVQQLPESRRAAARAAMLSQVPGLDPDHQKIGLDRTGRTDNIAGVTCRVVQIVRNGEAAESLCVADADALSMSAGTFTTVKSMFGLLQTILAGTGMATVGLPYLKLSGMPIRFSDSVTGNRRKLIQISHDPIDDFHFDIPENYVEQAVSSPES